jgi:hypothetical protein
MSINKHPRVIHLGVFLYRYDHDGSPWSISTGAALGGPSST